MSTLLVFVSLLFLFFFLIGARLVPVPFTRGLFYYLGTVGGVLAQNVASWTRSELDSRIPINTCFACRRRRRCRLSVSHTVTGSVQTPSNKNASLFSVDLSCKPKIMCLRSIYDCPLPKKMTPGRWLRQELSLRRKIRLLSVSIMNRDCKP